MKKIIFILVILACLTITLYSQWSIISQPSSNNLYGLFFTSENTGIVCGDQGGNILRTTNGGATFTSTPSGCSVWFLDVFFINILTGFASGQDGYIVKTTDNGITWSLVSQTGAYMHSIRFPSVNTGYAGGANGILKSTNNGLNWISINNPFGYYILGIYFLDNNTGYVCGGNNVILGKTTDGGSNWTNLVFNSSDYYEKVVFTNYTTGYAAGKNGVIIKTTNGGTNWVYQNSTTNHWLFNIFMLNANTGWACGESGTIVNTTNGGNTWNNQPTNISSIIRKIYFINSNVGYAVCDAGIILKTTNGGNLIGIKPISNIMPSEYSLSQNYPNPFNPSTTIEFSLPKSSFAQLNIYDIFGKKIQTIVNDELKAGTYKISFFANNLSSGVYYYKLLTNQFSLTKKMILIK